VSVLFAESRGLIVCTADRGRNDTQSTKGALTGVHRRSLYTVSAQIGPRESDPCFWNIDTRHGQQWAASS